MNLSTDPEETILSFEAFRTRKRRGKKTETKLNTFVTSVLNTFTPDSIHRAHRLGFFTQNKCRPIIAKFTNSKIKDKLLSLCSEFKLKDVVISEDFSPVTRMLRQKLFDFANSQPDSPRFLLRYNKLFLNNKCYMYNPHSDRVEEVERSHEVASNNNDLPQNTS